MACIGLDMGQSKENSSPFACSQLAAAASSRRISELAAGFITLKRANSQIGPGFNMQSCTASATPCYAADNVGRPSSAGCTPILHYR